MAARCRPMAALVNQPLDRPPLLRGHPEPGEEVVPLVVDDDEGGEVLDLGPPDGLHAELRILQHLDLADAVLRQARGGPPMDPR